MECLVRPKCGGGETYGLAFQRLDNIHINRTSEKSHACPRNFTHDIPPMSDTITGA